MTTQQQLKSSPEHVETSISDKFPEDARPIGLMPPSFPSDYIAGSVAPFFMATNYLGEAPSLSMIDLTLTKEGACPAIPQVGGRVSGQLLDHPYATSRPPLSRRGAQKRTSA